MTLTDFLLSRIVEDEDAGPRHPEWCAAVRDDQSCDCDGVKRALAECEAKRRIIDFFEHHPRQHWLDLAMRREIIANLALPYADHPDYREEWRP